MAIKKVKVDGIEVKLNENIFKDMRFLNLYNKINKMYSKGKLNKDEENECGILVLDMLTFVLGDALNDVMNMFANTNDGYCDPLKVVEWFNKLILEFNTGKK